MKKDEKASISLMKIILISLVIVGVMGFTVMATNSKLNNVKIVLSNNYEMSVFTTKTKIADILEENHIVLLSDEKSVPDINQELTDNKTIKIIKGEEVVEKAKDEQLVNVEEILENYDKITEKIVVVEEVIPFETITKDISDGSAMVKEKIIKNGKNGLRKVTYKIRYQNDIEIERVEISSEIIEEPVDKIVEVRVKTVTNRESSLTRSSVSYSNGVWNYSKNELDLLCAITAQECGSSYNGALAVITCACNRAESTKWGGKGKDPLSQYKAKGQFCYSIDSNWKRRLNGNYSSSVEKAVVDALNGKRNHDYLSFRSARSGVKGEVIGGNVYFGK
ncbi:MAG: G5 domain-containing protein [Clostridia bacterium]|nr:G5 domain-containing protein [Clostridia bacterium]